MSNSACKVLENHLLFILSYHILTTLLITGKPSSFFIILSSLLCLLLISHMASSDLLLFSQHISSTHLPNYVFRISSMNNQFPSPPFIPIWSATKKDQIISCCVILVESDSLMGANINFTKKEKRRKKPLYH